MEFKYLRSAYYYETDRMDIVHHSNYVRWLEESRVEMMEKMGFPFSKLEAMGVMVPVLSVQTEYFYPVRFGDKFEVTSKLTDFNGCKFSLEYEVRNVTQDKLSLKAKTSHCFTNSQLRPVRLKKVCPELYELYLKYMEKKFCSKPQKLLP